MSQLLSSAISLFYGGRDTAAPKDSRASARRPPYILISAEQLVSARAGLKRVDPAQAHACSRALPLQQQDDSMHARMLRELAALWDKLGILDDNASRPPDDSASRPPDDSASRPPDDSASRPPDDSASRPPDDSASRPPDDSASRPPDDSASRPPDDKSEVVPSSTDECHAQTSSCSCLQVHHANYTSAATTANDVGVSIMVPVDDHEQAAFVALG